LDITHEFFGDPPPGRSALDQKYKDCVLQVYNTNKDTEPSLIAKLCGCSEQTVKNIILAESLQIAVGPVEPLTNHKYRKRQQFFMKSKLKNETT